MLKVHLKCLADKGIANAVMDTPSGGTIEVVAERRSNRIAIEHRARKDAPTADCGISFTNEGKTIFYWTDEGGSTRNRELDPAEAAAALLMGLHSLRAGS